MLSHVRGIGYLRLTKMVKIFLPILIFTCLRICIADQDPFTCRLEENSLPQLKKCIKAGALDFSSNLAKQLARDSPNQNFMVSPFSVYRGLAVLYQGAAQKSESEFENVLGLRNIFLPPKCFMTSAFRLEILRKSHVQEVLEEVSRNLQSSQRWNFDVSTGNAIFVQDGVRLKNRFREDILRYSDVEVRTIDFARWQSTFYINQWISDKTRGHVSRLQRNWFGPDPIFSVSMNVFYFDAMWANGFDRQWTKKDYFTVEPNQAPVLVDMMHNINRVPYYRSTSRGYTAIGLPLVNKSFVMYFIQPEDPRRSAAELIEILTPAELKSMTGSSLKRPCWVDYRIPRIEFASKMNLNAQLKSLGIQSAFDKKAASFQDMMDEGDSLYLSAFGHTTDLKITEKGVVAISPGFTLVSESEEGSCGNGEPLVFSLDRPFVVVLYHTDEEFVLSYGVVHNPLLN